METFSLCWKNHLANSEIIFVKLHLNFKKEHVLYTGPREFFFFPLMWHVQGENLCCHFLLPFTSALEGYRVRRLLLLTWSENVKAWEVICHELKVLWPRLLLISTHLFEMYRTVSRFGTSLAAGLSLQEEKTQQRFRRRKKGQQWQLTCVKMAGLRTYMTQACLPQSPTAVTTACRSNWSSNLRGVLVSVWVWDVVSFLCRLQLFVKCVGEVRTKLCTIYLCTRREQISTT